MKYKCKLNIRKTKNKKFQSCFYDYYGNEINANKTITTTTTTIHTKKLYIYGKNSTEES